jgi:predicted amidohydrolase YtcJ
MAADLAVFGARIRTMDPERPQAAALAVKDGVLVAVGTDDEVRHACDASTKVLGEAGWAITPGLTDGHQHLFSGAEHAQGVDFDRIADLDGIRAALAAARKRAGTGKWVLGYALEYAAFGGRRFHHDLIDAAAGDGPVLVYSLDHHTAFANAEALRLAGVDGPRRFDSHSVVVCDESGRPTGELQEMDAAQLVRSAMPTASPDEKLSWYKEAIRKQNAVGLTGVHLMDGTFETIEVLEALEASGDLGLRVALHYSIRPSTDPSIIEELVRGAARSGAHWSASGVKFVIDGVVETGTAWLEEPDSEGAGTEPMWPDMHEFRGTVRQLHDAGFRIATHAIGDRAVREVLDTYETLPGGGGRHRIEHIETAPETTIARFAPLGITASMQPIHLRWMKPDLSDPWSQRLGPHRCAHTMPSGDLSAKGALVVLGSDWPVAPFDPRLGFVAAQLRRAPDIEDAGPIGASRPLSGAETLAGYTTNAARAIGDPDVAGMLRPGFRADFVAWGEDPSVCPAGDVAELPVCATVVGGRLVYQAE